MSVDEFLEEWHSDSSYVCVQTSGSTGSPKPMLVEKRRMEASARITCDFLGLRRGDIALLCMPLDYIAGKMMVVRAETCGLRLVSVPPSGHPAWEGPIDFAAMVPLQVYNLLQTPDGRERLRSIHHLIIGGGAIDEGLAAALADFPHHVWSTYGMTETLSHVALRRLNGPDASEWYTPFPSVRVSLNDDICLVIDAPVVHDGPLVTNDIAELVYEGQIPFFRILGRKDNVICSAGVKIQAEEVERQLRPHLSMPYLITRRRDAKFGEIVVLLTEGDIKEAETVARHVLPKYWQPRAYVHVTRIPLTETGKPARQVAERLAKEDG
jgi:O-succinylbenzoic acid--CoA ligase